MDGVASDPKLKLADSSFVSPAECKRIKLTGIEGSWVQFRSVHLSLSDSKYVQLVLRSSAKSGFDDNEVDSEGRDLLSGGFDEAFDAPFELRDTR